MFCRATSMVNMFNPCNSVVHLLTPQPTSMSQNTQLFSCLVITKSTFKGNAATSPIAKMPGMLVLNWPSTWNLNIRENESVSFLEQVMRFSTRKVTCNQIFIFCMFNDHTIKRLFVSIEVGVSFHFCFPRNRTPENVAEIQQRVSLLISNYYCNHLLLATEVCPK